VIEEAKRRARTLIKARTVKPPDAKRRQELLAQIENLASAIATGALRASPAIAAKLREAEDELARVEAESTAPAANVERLIPRLAEEIESAIRALPKTLAAGNVNLARQELKGYLGLIRVVAEPTRMLLYSERNAAEAVIARAVGAMGSIVGSGGVMCSYPGASIRHRVK
jgi:hypothetical protein